LERRFLGLANFFTAEDAEDAEVRRKSKVPVRGQLRALDAEVRRKELLPDRLRVRR
jgi:hypothetical protein